MSHENDTVGTEPQKPPSESDTSKASGTPRPPAALESATRSLSQATHVSLAFPPPPSIMHAAKAGFAHQLGLTRSELDAAAATGAMTPELAARLKPFATDDPSVPGREALADVTVSQLQAFGRALATSREAESAEKARKSRAALDGLALNAGSQPVGMLNLERLEMTPSGIEQGELIATIPLAPGEETAVVEKEWSVLSQEFTSIVSDEMENYNETGVTDNTELAQSTTSQQEHSNQFNITGTVSGGIPVINGSATSSFGSQGKESQSATESRKQAKTLTQKASSRSKREHKVTINTKTVAGREETVTRTLRNTNTKDPIRIDYFSLMRKWRVRLYRYGLRLTYDVAIPEPGAAMRRTYKELAELKARLGPFEFPVTHGDIKEKEDDPKPGDPPVDPNKPKPYQVLADRYDASVPDPPPAELPRLPRDEPSPDTGKGWHKHRMTFKVPDGYEIKELAAHFHLGHLDEDKDDMAFGIDGTGFELKSEEPINKRFVLTTQPQLPGGPDLPPSNPFPANPYLGATGEVAIQFFLYNCAEAIVGYDYIAKRTEARYQQWQTDVWNLLFEAAQTKYYAEQQDIAAKIADIEERILKVDTLTLRREESDEIMRGVLRFIAGANYVYMSDEVRDAFKRASRDGDSAHGIGFTENRAIGDVDFGWVKAQEAIIRFVNQAIEWESVSSFLYSYFWDTPDSWDFIREIQHLDKTRQAFLRAGSARVVLTVRKGWETRWLKFAQSGFVLTDGDPDEPYLSIAKEIAAYDDRNYPGIPPANPAKESQRIADSVVTTSTAAVAASPSPVTIEVESTEGIVAGVEVVIGETGLPNTQEVQVVQKVVPGNRLVVAKLDHPHDGTHRPFPVIRPGEKGVVIAEWSEYTPNSGTDIRVTSNLAEIV